MIKSAMQSKFPVPVEKEIGENGDLCPHCNFGIESYFVMTQTPKKKERKLMVMSGSFRNALNCSGGSVAKNQTDPVGLTRPEGA